LNKQEDQQDEYGWKLVHGDVFRAPFHRMWLSVLLGNGVQSLLMCLVTLCKLQFLIFTNY